MVKHLNSWHSDSTSAGLIPRSLLRKGAYQVSQSPSFPHVFSGNPGETRTGPPIRTFGGDEFASDHRSYRYAACRVAEADKLSNQLSALIYLPISRKVSGV